MMKELNNVLKSGVTSAAIRQRLIRENKVAKEKAQVIINEMPDYVQDIIQKADQALEGKLLLPGTGGVPTFVGNPPAWFQRMNDDNEFLWQLSRMEHWMYLVEAYSYTGKKKYALKVLEEFKNWNQELGLKEIDYFDKPIEFFVSVHPMRILECGIRLYKTWPFIIEHLIDTDLLDDDFLETYLFSVYVQAKLIATHSPVFWPDADHNHYIMECLGLLTTSLMFPEFKESQSWSQLAFRELDRCSQKQLTEVGGQIEACPSYHNGCMFWFGMVMIIAKKYEFSISDSYIERYMRNLDFSLHSMRPTGKTYPLGDSHANNLAIMSAVFGYFALDEMYWLNHLASFLPIDEIRSVALSFVRYCLTPSQFSSDMTTIHVLEEKQLLPTNLYNAEIGQAFVRSAWDRTAHGLAFTCRSPVQNGHAHIDLLSFEYVALGKNIIADPGILTYKDNEDRRFLKSSASHSTLMIDQKNFFEYINSWTFGPQKEGKLLDMVKSDRAVTVRGHHLSYDPTEIVRAISLVDNQFLLVYDRVLNGKAESQVSRTYHMDYTDVIRQERGILAMDSQVSTLIVDSANQGVELIDAILSDVNDVSRASKRVVFSNQLENENDYLTIIYPFKTKEGLPEISLAKNSEGNYMVTVNHVVYAIRMDENKLEVR